MVTGCAGFIGSHLTEALLSSGHSVLGIDCFNDNYGRSRKFANLEHATSWEAFDFVPIDLARGNLAGPVEDVDAIFHLAAEPGVRTSWGERFELYVRNNVLATQHLLEAARRFPEKRFVFASSSSVYGEAESLPTPEDVTPRPHSPYGVTKLDAEHLCNLYHANYGVNAVSLRYFSVYGPRQRPDMAFHAFCHAALRDEPITVYGDGRQTRDFTFVGDIVAATLSAAQAGAAGTVFNIGGGSRTSVAEALELIGELAGRPLRVERRDHRHGEVHDTAADTSRARSELGYEPRTSLADGLRAEFEWISAATQMNVAA